MLIDSTGQRKQSPLMTLTAYSIQGRRNHMEDFFDIGYKMKQPELLKPGEWPYEYFYFGIFDGHGGHEASKFAKRSLVKYIVGQDDFWSDDDQDVMRAIRKGFADTHSAMRRHSSKWARTSRTLPSTAGTTASVLFIKNGKYYTGHVGDSRIVISRQNRETKQWIADQLTEDHKPELEVDRIVRAGGQVRQKTGVQRVVWKRPVLDKECETGLLCSPDSDEYLEVVKQIPNYPIDESLVSCYQFIPFLAIARSLGDFWSINPLSGQYVVSPEPDIDCCPISPNDTGIILATDGLWNVMDAMRAVRMLQELEMKKDLKENKQEHFITDNFYDVAGEEPNPAQSMVYFAYQIWERKRARSDNITVVFARLWDIVSHFPKSCKTYPTRLSTQLNTQKHSLANLQSTKHKAEMTVQIRNTSCYMETIYLDKEPTFACQQHLDTNDWYALSNLEHKLLLPPTIVDPSNDLIFPKNYELLSNATGRVIPSFAKYCLDYYNVIRIKNVTDDPADLLENEPYVNGRGKMVRDSSAQVSDWLHDFGQPWDQLQIRAPDEEHDDGDGHEDEHEDEEFDFKDDELNDEELETTDKFSAKVIKLFASKWNKDKDDESIEDEEEEEDHAEDELVKTDEDDKEATRKETVIESSPPSIPQLRCLLNYTPPLRRSKRKIYLSASEDSKKKCQIESIQTMSKNKRRKSQPANCNLTRL